MHDVVKDYYAPIHLAMSSVGKYLEVENVVRDEASLYSKGFSGVHVGLFKDIIYIPLLDLYNYSIYFFFLAQIYTGNFSDIAENVEVAAYSFSCIYLRKFSDAVLHFPLSLETPA